MSIEWTEPTTSAPAPALWELPAAIPEDAPAYTPPIPAYASPAPTFAPPMQAYEPPAPGYGPPTEAYEPPTEIHEPATQAYSAPPATFVRPASAPAQGPAAAAHAAPAFAHQGFVAPPAAVAPSRPTASAEHPLVVASLGRRVVGHLLDGLILAVSGGLLILGVDALLGISATAERADGSIAAVFASLAYVVLVSLVQFGYRTVPALSGMRGQSVGQLALGLRFVRTDGTRASAGLAMRRASAVVGPPAVLWLILALATSLIASLPLIFVGMLILVAYPVADFLLAPLAGLGRQTLHDRMAGTVVVDANSASPLPGDEPATIVGRPRTGATWSFSIGATFVVVVALGLLAILASIGFAAAEGVSYESQDTYEVAPYSYS